MRLSAIKQLQDQVRGTEEDQGIPLVDLSLRFELAQALRDSGKFTEVRIKMDSRRGSLSYILGVNDHRAWDKIKFERIADDHDLEASFRLTSGGGYERIYRVETLKDAGDVVTTPAKPAVTVAPSPTAANMTLPQALAAVQAKKDGKVAVVLGGYNIGSVSPAAADRIKKIVADDNLPKFAEVTLIDVATASKVKVTVPYDVSQAIAQKVPSFATDAWTIKSTAGMVIVTELKTNRKLAVV
jgi:hypothetical protein